MSMALTEIARSRILNRHQRPHRADPLRHDDATSRAAHDEYLIHPMDHLRDTSCPLVVTDRLLYT